MLARHLPAHIRRGESPGSSRSSSSSSSSSSTAGVILDAGTSIIVLSFLLTTTTTTYILSLGRRVFRLGFVGCITVPFGGTMV
jgi:hypothetical protein